MKYPALFEPAEEGGFVITFPDVEGAISQGDGEQDALEMARDALVTMLAHSIRHGKPVQPPTQPRGRKYRMIELPAMVALKTELYIAFQGSGIRKAELARRLGIPKTTVDRLFDFANHTRLDQIEAAFAALGKRIALEVNDAA
ncbi:MAG: type II toxin-antitoxin system HicB family antitoxin [Bryobacteraceae bacterium]